MEIECSSMLADGKWNCRKKSVRSPSQILRVRKQIDFTRGHKYIAHSWFSFWL